MAGFFMMPAASPQWKSDDWQTGHAEGDAVEFGTVVAEVENRATAKLNLLMMVSYSNPPTCWSGC